MTKMMYHILISIIVIKVGTLEIYKDKGIISLE